MGVRGTSPEKNFQFNIAETPIFLKIGIKIVHEKKRPKRSTCVQIYELASLDAKNLRKGKHCVHRRSLAYKEQVSFCLRNSNSRRARTILIDRKGLEIKKKKKPMLDHSKLPWGGLGLYTLWCWRLFFSFSCGFCEKNCFGNWFAHGYQTAAEDPSKKCVVRGPLNWSRWKVNFFV